MIAEQLSCEVIIAGALPQSWADWFPRLDIRARLDGDTSLAGQLPDQAAFHGMCSVIRDLGLPIVLLHVERARR